MIHSEKIGTKTNNLLVLSLRLRVNQVVGQEVLLAVAIKPLKSSTLSIKVIAKTFRA